MYLLGHVVEDECAQEQRKCLRTIELAGLEIGGTGGRRSDGGGCRCEALLSLREVLCATG